MGKKLCMSAAACLLIAALLSGIAAILANKALAAENHKKHVKVLFFKCEAGTSHDAYVLSLYALILLVIAHIVANFIVAYDYSRKEASVCSQMTAIIFLLGFWASGGFGMFLLFREMKSDNKSGGHCGLSLINQLTSYAWICCAAHAVFSLAYLMVTLVISKLHQEEIKGKGPKEDGRV